MLIVANPAAGGMRSDRRLRRVVAALEARGCTVAVRYAGAEGAGLEQLARNAEDAFDVVVAAGGDGTVNAVVNGIAGVPRALGILPLGTVNLVARALGLPRQPDALAAIIATAVARPIWPAVVNGRLFLSVASSGFDAEIVAAVDPWLKRRFGRFAFVPAVLCGLLHYRPCEVVVAVDGREYHAAIVVVAKGRYYAGPFRAAPRAALDEAMLDVVLLKRAGRFAALRYLAALACGALPRLRDVTTVRCTAATLSAAQYPLAVQADGEIVGRLPAKFALADKPLLVLRPCRDTGGVG